MSKKIALASVGALVATALTSPVLSAPAAGGAAAPAAASVTVWAPKRVDVASYNGTVWDSLGVRLIADGAPFEIRSHRDRWKDPIRTEWSSGSASGSLPLGTQKNFARLPRFLKLTITNKRGVVKYRKIRGACLNDYETQRVRPDAPPRSPYPWDCPSGDFVKGSVQGVQEGWAASIDNHRNLKLRPGRYTASATVTWKYANRLGLSKADRTRTFRLVVHQADENYREQRRSRRRDRVAQPAEQEPRGSSGGTSDGPQPDLRALPAFGMQIAPNGNFLRFSATVWNAGDSPLVVDGFRRDGEDVMDAYQYFFDQDGNQTGYQKVGKMEWHAANHQHWHFHDFARYRLLNADKTQAVRSKKESFCLANTDAIDYTVPGADWQPENTDLATACGGRDALSIREVLASGSGDTYAQFRAGQSFRLKGLPNGVYYIAVEANPVGRLVESDTSNNQVLRKIRLGGKPGARTVRWYPIGVVQDGGTDR